MTSNGRSGSMRSQLVTESHPDAALRSQIVTAFKRNTGALPSLAGEGDHAVDGKLGDISIYGQESNKLEAAIRANLKGLGFR